MRIRNSVAALAALTALSLASVSALGSAANAAPSPSPKASATPKASPSPSASASASASSSASASASPSPTKWKKQPPLVVWADQTRANVLKAQFPKGYHGSPLTIVVKDMAAIKTDLATATKATAPDIVAAEHTWTGGMVDAGELAPIDLDDATANLFPTNILSGFSYAGKQYGVPVSYENVALVTNAKLIKKAPSSFAELSRKALRLKNAGTTSVALAVGQGAAGDAYHMYPLFSGLGGYVFGTAADGALDLLNLGIDNSVFKKNQSQIDVWNDSGLIDSTLTGDAAKAAFAKGDAPFWITGPWNAVTLSSLKFKYRISPVPNIVTGLETAPFLGMKGFALTSFALKHKRLKAAKDFLRTGLTTAAVQTAFGQAAGRMPAAKAGTAASPLIGAFGASGLAGVPIPNVPQMDSVWGPLGKAWATSTAGAAAVPAKQSFADAQTTIQAAIG